MMRPINHSNPGSLHRFVTVRLTSLHHGSSARAVREMIHQLNISQEADPREKRSIDPRRNSEENAKGGSVGTWAFETRI